jgi:hypothetical protein
MFTKSYFIKYFCTSLKQKKQNLIKNKKIENTILNNINKIHESEFEAFMTRFTFHKTINRLSLFFILAPSAYYFLAQYFYPLYSKELTDIYNASLNFIVTSNALYVNCI